MTIQELKDLILQKIKGQGNQVDVGGALPPVLNGILDILVATQNITQVIVTVDEGTGTPSAEASVTDGVLTLNFHNLKGEKGEQGNTGSSVDYPFELVNNLTTDDATKGLSAAQGVVLDGKISQLGQKLDIYQPSALNVLKGCVEELYVPSYPGSELRLRSNSSNVRLEDDGQTVIAFASPAVSSNGQVYPLVVNVSSNVSYPVGSVVGYVVMSDYATFIANPSSTTESLVNKERASILTNSPLIADYFSLIPLEKKEGLDNLTNLLNNRAFSLEQGGLNAYGQGTNSNKRIRTDYIKTDIGIITAPDGFLVHEVYYYDSTKTFVSPYKSIAKQTYRFESTYPYAKAVFRKEDDTNVVWDELISKLVLIDENEDYIAAQKGARFDTFFVLPGRVYGSTKSIEASNANHCHIRIPIDWIEKSVTAYGFPYIPGTSSDVYTKLIFFDSNGNSLIESSYAKNNEITVNKPANAAQCYLTIIKTAAAQVMVKVDKEGVLDGNIVELNSDRQTQLSAACRYRKTSNTSKDFQMLIVTDSHGDDKCVERGVVATNGFSSIDAMIHLGDVAAAAVSMGEDVAHLWNDIVAKADKPTFFTVGNHEKGTYKRLRFNPPDAELYNDFIKVSVDRGWLKSGEYTVGKCYWYHDFASYKIRLINLDECDGPYIIDDSKWTPVTYDSTAPDYVIGQAYAQGDKINVPNYTDYSFEAVSGITITNEDEDAPCLKYTHGLWCIGATQAQWFLDTLASTPSGYSVIVSGHYPFSDQAQIDNTKKFSQDEQRTIPTTVSFMSCDFIASAINAFVTKSNFSVTCVSRFFGDDNITYSVSKDFSNIVGTFHSLIGGHVHRDWVLKHQTYNQWQIVPVDSNSIQWDQSANCDIRRASSASQSSIDIDCLTVVSFGSGRLGLVKLGVNVNEDGRARDFEVIDIS